MPKWCRSRWTFFLALCIWVISGFVLRSPWIEVLLFAALLVYDAWLEGWRRFLRQTLPCVVLCTAAFMVNARVREFFFGIGGSLLFLLGIAVALLLWSFFLRLIGVGNDDGSASRPWSEIWADLRARTPSWAQVRSAQQVPAIKTVYVTAAQLAGVVEYDTVRLSGVRVEECATADWAQQLSEAQTDENGRFALPAELSAPFHWLRVSWPPAETVHLLVELSPRAKPLLVRLKPRKYTAYLGGRSVSPAGETRQG